MTPTIAKEASTKFDLFLKDHVESGKTPALLAGLTTSDQELYFGAYGDRRLNEEESGKVGDDTNSEKGKQRLMPVLQLFSQTKFVTCVAVMQQVEKGLLTLDDPEIVLKYCPELGELPICKGYDEHGQAILEKPENKITLRMLLDHTSGLGYEFTAPWLTRWRKEHNLQTLFEANADVNSYTYPLHHEPGTHWTYGIGLDWAGFMLERLLGKDLDTILQENIFKPCGITTMTFYPPEDDSKLFGLCERTDGKLSLNKVHPMKRTFDRSEMKTFNGGGGLFGNPRDYLVFLRHVLKSAKGEQGALLSKESFKALFTSSIPRTPEVKKDLATFGRFQDQYDPSFVENDQAEFITYGLALMVNLKDSVFGRKAGSGSWDGAAKSCFWVDPSTGIAGTFCTNLLAENPDPFLTAYNDYERLVYDNLQTSSAL